MVLLCLLPTLVAIAYAVVVQYRLHNRLNVLLLLTGGFIALFNASFVYKMFVEGNVTVTLRCLQQLFECMIVPVAYMFFSTQMGRKWCNSVTITLWSLVALLLVPLWIFPLDLVMPQGDHEGVMPMTLHFFKNGKKVLIMNTADVIIMTQSIITLARMFTLRLLMRRYHLALSPKMRYFYIWWASAVVFIIFISTCTGKEFQQQSMLWCYFIGYSVLSSSVFILIGLNFDLRIILLTTTDNNKETDLDADQDGEQQAQEDVPESSGTGYADTNIVDIAEGEAVEDVDSFLLQCHILAERLKVMLFANNRYLESGLTADVVIRELGTNRTYFYRMLKAEYGCTFNELIVKHRMKHAATMLTSTELPIQDIAAKCGYADHTTFSRRFRQVYGTTPSKYRGDKQDENQV